MASSDPSAGPIAPEVLNEPFLNLPGDWPQVHWTQVEFTYDHDRAVAVRSILFIIASLIAWACYTRGTPLVLTVVVIWPFVWIMLMGLVYRPLIMEEPPHKGAPSGPKPSRQQVHCVLWVDPLDETQLKLTLTREIKRWFGKSSFTHISVPLADLETFEKTTLNAYLKQPSDEIRFIENYLILAHVHGRNPVIIAQDGGGSYRVDHLFQVLSATFQAQRSALIRQHQLGHRKQRYGTTPVDGVPDRL